MKAPVARLNELCHMDRQTVRPDDPIASQLPYVGVENVGAGTGIINFDTDSRVGNQKSTTSRFDERHVLYAKLRPYLNKVATPGFAGRCSTELVPLLPRDGVDREFIAHLLRRRETIRFVMASVTGSRMPRTDMKALMSMRVPLPPLDEQRRIVGILNRAAKIERLRNQAADRLREFIPALFTKMFGDPVENPMGWEVRVLGDIVQGFQGGKNVQAGSGESRYRILKVSAVTTGYFNPSMSKPAPDDYVPPSDHVVRPGDLLISRANTSALVGATAMVDDVESHFLLPDKIWRFVWRENSVIDPVYIHNLFKTRLIRSRLSAMATGTSGSMKNVSQARLKTLPVLVPPIDEQRRFAEMVAFARTVSNLGDSGSNIALALSASLMARLLGNAA